MLLIEFIGDPFRLEGKIQDGLPVLVEVTRQKIKLT